MQHKHRKLLAQLPLDGSAVTAGALAARLGISVRSVKTYIRALTAEHPDLIQSTARGYVADRKLAAEALGSPEEGSPNASDGRVRYLIRRILEQREGASSLIDLADELFVSEVTLRKDLPNLRRRLKEFDLSLDGQERALRIVGSEANKRRMLSETIYIEFNANILSLAAIGRAFPDYDVASLKGVLQEVCNTHRYFLNEYAMMSLVLDLLIIVDRIRNNFLTETEDRLYDFGSRERELADDIAAHMEALYRIKFNRLERNELALLLLGHITPLDYAALTMENIGNVVGEDTMTLMALITRELEPFEILDFENQELLLRFTLHIHTLLKRLEHRYVTKNPLTEHIKRSCTSIYELAVLTAGVLNRVTGYRVDQQETAYIALHIGSMLQIQQSYRNKARCVLVYPQYYDGAGRLTEQLHAAFGPALAVLGVATAPEEVGDFGQTDLLLTTVKLPPCAETEVVTVSPFFTAQDRQAVRAGLDAVIKRKRIERLRASLLELSDPALFHRNLSLAGAEETIRYLAGELVKGGYAESGFPEAVLERERSYSTAYGDVAVPHAMKMEAKRTGLAVCLSDKPIPWGEGRVRIALLFSISAEDRGKFHEVFENLIVLLLEPGNAAKVAAARTHGEFIEAILSCL